MEREKAQLSQWTASTGVDQAGSVQDAGVFCYLFQIRPVPRLALCLASISALSAPAIVLQMHTNTETTTLAQSHIIFCLGP